MYTRREGSQLKNTNGHDSHCQRAFEVLAYLGAELEVEHYVEGCKLQNGAYNTYPCSLSFIGTFSISFVLFISLTDSTKEERVLYAYILGHRWGIPFSSGVFNFWCKGYIRLEEVRVNKGWKQIPNMLSMSS